MSDTPLPITLRDRRRLADAITTLRRAELAFASDNVRELADIMAGVDPRGLVELVDLIAAPTGIEIAVVVELPAMLPFTTSVFVEAGDAVGVSTNDLGCIVVTSKKGRTA